MDDNKEMLRYVDEMKRSPEFKEKYSDFLPVDLAAKLLNKSQPTIYAKSSDGSLDLCKCNIGRRITFIRDCLLDQLAKGSLDLSKASRRRPRPSRQEIQHSLMKYIKLMLKDRDFQTKYEGILTVASMAELLKAKRPSIYEWIGRGLLNRCKLKNGRHTNIVLNCLLVLIAHGGLNTAIRSAKPESPEPPGEIRTEIEYV